MEWVVDAYPYAAGQQAARRQAGNLTGANMVERAAEALVAYLRWHDLAFPRVAHQAISTTSQRFADGFLAEAVRIWTRAEIGEDGPWSSGPDVAEEARTQGRQTGT